MIVLQILQVHVPPALAVALLPMVMEEPTLRYPCAVGLGTLTLTVWFWCWARRTSDERGVRKESTEKRNRVT
jgi:hypothetical protein